MDKIILTNFLYKKCKFGFLGVENVSLYSLKSHFFKNQPSFEGVSYKITFTFEGGSQLGPLCNGGSQRG